MDNIVEALSQDFELPDDLIEETLTYLPAEYIWKLGTSGNEEWNKSPWLIAGNVDKNRDCWAYSIRIRGKWQTAPLSLPFMNLYQEDAEQIHVPFSYRASSASLFLFERNVSHSIYVCNPVTGKFFTLPPMVVSPEDYDIGEIGIVQNGDGYKVVALHYADTQDEKAIVGVYDSTDKQWTMAGRLPLYLSTTDDVLNRMVFSGDYFYFLMRFYDTRDDEMHVILGFNLREGTFLFVSLPVIVNNIINDPFASDLRCLLLNCGSRILLVVILELEKVVIVWEWNRDADWKEITRMPDWILSSTNEWPTLELFDCAGTEDCIYFQKHREFVMYSLSKNSWTLLPSCPFAEVRKSCLILFEPRPHMKVD